VLDLLLSGWAIEAPTGSEILDSTAAIAPGLNFDPIGTQVEELEADAEPLVEPDPDVIEPSYAYELVLEHRMKRFNSVEVLKRLEYPKGGKAQIDVPLCRMKSLQVVQPVLINDILKL
jgi:hypothetical protein